MTIDNIIIIMLFIFIALVLPVELARNKRDYGEPIGCQLAFMFSVTAIGVIAFFLLRN